MYCRKGLFFTATTSAALAGVVLFASGAQAAHGAHVRLVHRAGGPSAYLKHIVVIVQEGRTVDNLFNGFCVNSSSCADTVSVDPSSGKPLTPESLAAPFAPANSHAAFLLEYGSGRGNGFAQDKIKCHPGIQCAGYSALSYVPSSETTIYQQLATVDGVLSDRTFETEQGPSFPSHYYAIAGQSGGYGKSHDGVSGGSGSCNAERPVPTINVQTGHPGPKSVSCQDFATIFDELAQVGHTWRYYTDSVHGTFTGPLAIEHFYHNPNIIIGSKHFLTDVQNSALADVSYVMPATEGVSDMPGQVTNAEAGPEWVASLVDAVGNTPYWDNTAIVIYWSNWGGWFDHVVPPGGPASQAGLSYGFRVPLLVAGGYAKTGAIDHASRTFASSLRLIEETFGLPSLGTMDQYEPDGLDPLFDFSRKPHAYVPLG